MATAPRNRISDVPNEILEQILGYLHGPATLYNFASSVTEAQALFEARAATVLSKIIKNGGMPCEIQMHLYAIISIRQAKLEGPLDCESLEACLNFYLSDTNNYTASDIDYKPNSYRDNVPLFDEDLLAAPMTFLKDCNFICSQIAIAEASFTKQQLPKMKRRVKTKKVSKGELDLVSTTRQRHRKRALSRTERYRVCRALCRLWLYYEISDIVRKWIGFAGKADWTIMHLLTDRMTIWEVEEMECLHHHLKYQSQEIWRQRCSQCNNLYLPEELPENRHGCGQDATTQKTRSWYSDDFSGGCCRFRELFYWPSGSRRIIWTDSPPGADFPGAGFTYLDDNWSDLCYGFGTFFMRLRPARCYLDWGYCIWDEKRLRKRKLIHRPDKGPEKACRLWKEKHVCEHGRYCRWRGEFKVPYGPRKW